MATLSTSTVKVVDIHSLFVNWRSDFQIGVYSLAIFFLIMLPLTSTGSTKGKSHNILNSVPESIVNIATFKASSFCTKNRNDYQKLTMVSFDHVT